MMFDPRQPPAGTVRHWLDARAAAGGIALVFPETGQELSWADLRDQACRMAKGLDGLGLQKGESVAIAHPNGREGVLALFAVLYGGFRATMINLAAGREAIGYALTHSDARFGFVHATQVEVIKAVAPEGLRMINFDHLGRAGALHPVQSGSDALLMYTSGTTGRPKGVVHTNASLLAGGWTAALAHQLGPSDRGLCVLPIYHINGLCVSVMSALVSGGSLAVVSRFSASQFWQQAEAGQVTWFSAVPTILSHLLHSETDPGDATKARLRFGRSASSALAVETQVAFEDRFKVPIVETMGLTETAAQILSNPLPPGRRKVGSPGVPFGNEVCILAPDRRPARPMTVGEIAVRGPNVMSRYLADPDATQRAFEGGWLCTGDLGYVDEDGYVFVAGRSKELIIKGGENIAPREIDEVLYSCSGVIEAAAFARPCVTYGERVEAAVAIRTGVHVSEAELIAICQDRLGSFKSPDKIHFLDALPKGPSGKIQRLKLAEVV